MQQLHDDDRRAAKEAFMRCFLPVRDRLLQFARAMSRTSEDADDLVSDTLLAAFERFDSLKDRQAFLSFLLTIASRIHHRRRTRMKLFGAYHEEQALAIAHPGPTPDAAADAALLHAALLRLPEKQREAVVLFELAGMPLEEIRAIQGGTLSGVKSRLLRGRERIAQLLRSDIDAAAATTKLHDAGDDDITLHLAELRSHG